MECIMSKDAFYFSHDSNARNDQRLMKIRMKHGMQGYGIYFGIVEILREQTEYCLSKKDIDSIAYDLRIDVDVVEDIIYNYDLFQIDDDSFHSRSLTRRMARMDVIREKRSLAGIKSGEVRSQSKQIDNTSSTSVQQTGKKEKKVKESKVKEIKERYIEFEDDVKSYQSLFGDDNTVNDFVSYWTEPNKSNTKMKFEMQPTWDVKRRIQRWIGNDFTSNKSNGVTKFKKDANGKFWMGYCSKCNVSDFYDDIGIKQDSRCCNSKLLPELMKKETN